LETQENYLQRLDDFADKLEMISLQHEQSSPEKDHEFEPVVIDSAQTIDDLGLKIENGEFVIHQADTSIKVNKTVNKEKQTDNKAHLAMSSEMTSGLVEQFSELALAPFLPLFSKIRSFYTHYQQRGLAAVFLMTVAGIITMTLGFTYLLQYSFNNWLSEIGKVSFAFISANTLLALGVYIYKRRAQMQEFASGLVGLGLIINYVSAYFSGPYFHLIPDVMSLILLLVISLFGFFLSFKFETKVIALLSLLGGSLAPMMLFSSASNQLIYLPYLLVIGCCALLQSRLLRWPLLIEVTALLHIICVELFVVSQAGYFEQLSIMALLGLLSINLMFYLYGFSGLYWLKGNDSTQLLLNKRLLVLPIALFAFTLLSITQLSIYSGYIFLFNGLIFAVAYAAVKSQPSLKVLALFLAGSFVGFAALQLLHQEFLGLVLFAEGLALLYLGCKADYRSVRFEAYLLVLLGLISHFFTLSEMIHLSQRALSDFSGSGFIVLYLVLSCVTLYAVSYQMKQLFSEGKNITFECKLFTFFRECLSVNYLFLILYCTALIKLDYALYILPLISILLLYLAKREYLKFSELLGWMLLLPLMVAVAIGIIDVGSARFSLQPLYGQITRIELFICFIGLYYWYKRFNKRSKGLKVARLLQVVCFAVLPLLFLPKVIRELPDYLSLALCLSTLISLLLAYIGRHRWLIFEAKLISLLAIVVIAMSCLNELWQGLLALSVGAILLAYLHQVYGKLPQLARLLLRFQWLLSPYYFSLVTVVVVFTLMSFSGLANWGIVMATIVIYFTQLLKIKPMPLVLRKSYQACFLLLLIPSFITLLLHLDSGLNLTIHSLLFMVAQVMILVSFWQLFINNGVALRLLSKSVPRLYLQWAWHTLLAVSYLVWSYQFSTMVAAPLSAILLVIHGSSLMFISLKVGQSNTIKLASAFFMVACVKVIFVDMASFLIIQKVIAFMLIGGILLAVSYFYQKMKNSLQQSPVE
ncbi:MAG: DUF2339 domain-containing protein, partial [Psychromonas sp.]|nr:DUF2339 domain-containing protein [Psychromonas sp.]